MKTMSVTILAIVLTGLFAGPASMSEGAATPVPYPEGYRRWAHVKSALVTAQHADFASSGGFRHIYANEKALSGYRNGKFPEGASIVVDWLETLESAGAFAEGARRRVDVMLKDSRLYGSTGGWGFERFKGDSRTDRIVTAMSTDCYACHASRRSADFVFSSLRH